MPSDIITIWNMALGYAGSTTRVNSETEKSPRAEACRLYYPNARDRALRSFDWPFARAYGVLAKVADVTPLRPFVAVYRLPTNAVAFRRIERDVAEDVVPFKLSRHPTGDGMLIHTNRVNPTGVWTISIDNPEETDALFANALAWALAGDLVINFTKQPQRQQFCLQGFAAAGAKAEADAGNEEPSKNDMFDRDVDWIAGRN